jgi:hypothetical protein
VVSVWCDDIPWQQFLDAIDGMVGDTREHVAQILFGIQAVEFGRADQGIEGGGAFAAFIGAGEKVILAVMKAFP